MRARFAVEFLESGRDGSDPGAGTVGPRDACEVASFNEGVGGLVGEEGFQNDHGSDAALANAPEGVFCGSGGTGVDLQPLDGEVEPLVQQGDLLVYRDAADEGDGAVRDGATEVIERGGLDNGFFWGEDLGRGLLDDLTRSRGLHERVGFS